ncbi:MAG: GNAT family N-acetyltransferase [Caldilineaceae bacterium]
MLPPTTFTSARLLLRTPIAADAEAIFQAYAQDPEVTRYLVWRPHRDLSETEAFIERCLTAWQQQTEFPYVITDKQTTQLLGMLTLRITGFAAAIGYGLRCSAWGQGIMPEAAGLVTDWALTQPSIYRVWAICDYENRASARVLEKIGMQCEGLMRRGVLHPNLSDEPRDCWLYARVK